MEVVHGHSSHHAKGIEVYRGKLILYGCGDFLNDYEGISGHESFRGDLALMYLARINPSAGKLVRLEMVPFQMKRFRLNRVSDKDTRWLEEVFNREGERFGTRFELKGGRSLIFRAADDRSEGGLPKPWKQPDRGPHENHL